MALGSVALGWVALGDRDFMLFPIVGPGEEEEFEGSEEFVMSIVGAIRSIDHVGSTVDGTRLLKPLVILVDASSMCHSCEPCVICARTKPIHSISRLTSCCMWMAGDSLLLHC